MLKTENARPSTWVYVDVRGRDLASIVADRRDPDADRKRAERSQRTERDEESPEKAGSSGQAK